MKTKTPRDKQKTRPGGSLKPVCSAIHGLKYIANSPPEEQGGFHPTTVQIAKDALDQIRELREAVLLYHEAWNGCERNWHAAMREASKNADKVLWPNNKLCDGRDEKP